MTSLEAMASGVPAIACHGVGAFSAQIKDDESGRLVEKDIAEALAGAPEDMLHDRAALTTAGHAACTHVEQNFESKAKRRQLSRFVDPC
ncbi:glycosyltransferase [Ruegeria conchae]|uniref:glycosyltransferase n=1 Tax=Ruegeria conchae TaxID=981384 RepID=UPI002D1E3A07|nr:glycosyltransferase [Ruegeria conchae]